LLVVLYLLRKYSAVSVTDVRPSVTSSITTSTATTSTPVVTGVTASVAPTVVVKQLQPVRPFNGSAPWRTFREQYTRIARVNGWVTQTAVTESRPKVAYHIRPKPYVPPKVKRNFRPKTETESQSYLSRHDYSQQVCPLPNYPVHLISFTFAPIMSAVRRVIKDTATRPHSTRCRRRQRSRFRGSQYTVRLMAPRVWHTLVSATQGL